MSTSQNHDFGFERLLIQEDFNRFAELSGDDNPIHVDPAFSARTKFGRTVAHGMFLYSCLCGGISRRYPGFMQVMQELLFPTPTYVNERVRFQLHAEELPGMQGVLSVHTFVKRFNGESGLQGRALLATPEVFDKTLQSILEGQAPPVDSDTHSHRGLTLGQSATTKRTFTQSDLDAYRELADDPDPRYRAYDAPSGPALPYGLLGGMVSYLLGTVLPGRGTNWLKQRYIFIQTGTINQPISAQVEIIRLRPQKELVNLKTVCQTPDGGMLSVGESLVWVSDLEPRTAML